MLDGFALLITEGNAASTPTLQRAVLAVADMPVEDVLRWGWMAVGASVALWDHEGWLASCTRQVQVLREPARSPRCRSTSRIWGWRSYGPVTSRVPPRSSPRSTAWRR